MSPELLVHGSCKCGWECACPEGYIWPKCPRCGGRVSPNRGQRRGFIAYKMDETDAVEAVNEARTQARIEAWL